MLTENVIHQINSNPSNRSLMDMHVELISTTSCKRSMGIFGYPYNRAVLEQKRI